MRKLKVVQRPKCKGWYVRTKIQGRDKWTYLSDNKAEADDGLYFSKIIGGSGKFEPGENPPGKKLPYKFNAHKYPYQFY